MTIFKLKKQHLYLIIAILASALILTIILSKVRNYKKEYIEAAENILNEFNIEDYTVTMTQSGRYETYELYTLKIESNQIDELPKKEIFQFYKKISNIYVSGAKYLVFEKIISNNNEYSLDGDNPDNLLEKNILLKNGIAFYRKEPTNTDEPYTYIGGKCSYQSCGDARTEGSKYCFTHTCYVDGCYNKSNTNTLFKYCNKHERELTCAVKGCCANRYMDSQYCGAHYPDGK